MSQKTSTHNGVTAGIVSVRLHLLSLNDEITSCTASIVSAENSALTNVILTRHWPAEPTNLFVQKSLSYFEIFLGQNKNIIDHETPSALPRQTVLTGI